MFRSIYRRLAHFFLSTFPFRLRGFWLYANPHHDGILQFLIRGQYENFATEVMIEDVKSGWVICDIGAHVGYYSMLFSKLVGPKGKVYAFEPDSENMQVLKRNIALNHASNIVTQNIAISDKKKIAKLYISKEDPTDHRLFNPPGEDRSYVEIKQDSLDNLFKGKKIDLIKIDVQGYESYCIDGALKTLNSQHTRLLVELWPQGLKELGINPLTFLKKILKLKYKIYFLNEKTKSRDLITDLDELILKGEKEQFINLYCIK
jgi:FkbM family methyltransferase